MNGLYDAAREIQRFIQANGWRFCIIGGLAVVRWGQPRATQDVDISLLTGFGVEADYVDLLLSRFPGRLTDARQFALANRVLLCRATNGVALDIALAGFPYEEQVIARASGYSFAAGITLVTASAEDVVVLKAFAGRDQDWSDIRGILERQARLDWTYILRELSGLKGLKEDTDPVGRLEALRQQTEGHPGP